MRRQHPSPRSEIPVSQDVYHQLLAASFSSGYQKEDWEIAAEAIDEWVRRHNPDGLTMTAGCSGYQWKRLFLPDGTLLRTVFDGKNYHCLVDGDRLVYEGQAVSPSAFVNAVGGIRRNAWTCSWILFPNTKEWKLADTLRTRQRPRPARALPTATEPAQPQPAPPVQAAVPAAAQKRQGVLPALKALGAPQTNAAPAPQTRSSGAARSGPTRTGISQLFRSAYARQHRSSRDNRVADLLRQCLLPLLYPSSGIIDAPHFSMPAPLIG